MIEKTSPLTESQAMSIAIVVIDHLIRSLRETERDPQILSRVIEARPILKRIFDRCLNDTAQGKLN